MLARPWAASDPLAAALQRTGRAAPGRHGPRARSASSGRSWCPGRPAACAARTCTAGTPTRAGRALAAQLTAAEPPPSGATVTCLLTAATAALQVLAYLDGTAAPATLDATVELRPPDLRAARCAGGRRTPPAAAERHREHSAATPDHSPGRRRHGSPGGTVPGQGRMDG